MGEPAGRAGADDESIRWEGETPSSDPPSIASSSPARRGGDRGARGAVREVESNRVLRVLARAGFAANGLVHGLVGAVVLVVAFGGRAHADQSGAFHAVAGVPGGFLALWLIAILLWMLAVWLILDSILERNRRGDSTGRLRKWGRRCADGGRALVLIAIGLIAATVATGARPNGEKTAEGASRNALAVPGGAFLLGAVGIGIAIGGVVFVVMGIRRRFRKTVSVPPGVRGAAVDVVGVVGYISKGVALLIVGVLLVVAAVMTDPAAAGGLDGAVQKLIGLPYGPWLAGFVGAGLVVYGVFLCARARYARL